MTFNFILVLIFILWAFVMGKTLHRAAKEHWLGVAIFGTSFQRTLGEIDLGTVGRKNMQLRVHSMGATEPGRPVVGIDLVNRTFASYRTSYFWLTADQAKLLQTLISRALAESPQ